MRGFVFSALLLSLITPSSKARAQDLLMAQKIAQQIASKQLSDCLENPDKCKELPADVVLGADPKVISSNTVANPLDKGVKCPADPEKKKPDDGKTVETSVLLVAEVHTPEKKTNGNLTQNQYYDANEYFGIPKTDEFWKTNDPTTFANGLKADSNFQPYADSMFIEGLVQTVGRENKTDDQMAEDLSKKIAAYAGKSDEEKMKLLSVLSQRLYNNYNDKRNPGQNTDNDPDVPKGNLSLAEQFSAAANYDLKKGGVCNDIVQATMAIGSKLFPDKDVLAINNGLHFAVAIHDKNGTTLIDGGDEQTDVAQPVIEPFLASSNTRVFKLDGSRLKEVAVLDTETGAVLKKYFDTETQALTTGVPPSVVYAEFKKEIQTAEKTKTFELKAGTAQTSKSQMVVFVGQKIRTTETSRLNLAVGASYSDSKEIGEKSAIFAFHAGYEKRLIRYKSPTVSIEGFAGAETDGSYALRLNMPNEYPSVSANLQTNQKIEFVSTPRNPNNPQVEASVQVVQAVGPGNVGNFGGANARMNVPDMLKSLTLHLNQVYATADVTKPISRNLSSITRMDSQITNIGIKLNLSSGIQLVTANGMKVFAFVGYVNNNIKGLQTKGSFFSDEVSGATSNAGIKTKNGMSFSTSVEGIGSGAMTTNVNAVIPVFTKKKKK